MWVQGRLSWKLATTRPGNIWPEEWSNMSDNYQRRATKKWAEEKTQIGCSESKDNSQTMQKETGNEGGDAMQSHHTSQSERFKLEATLCK